jgi:hypothetical protein
MTPWSAQRKQPGGSPGSAVFQLGMRLQSARPGCRSAVLDLFPGIRVHDWAPVEAIGHVVTYRCECGKTKTRVTGSPQLDRGRAGSPARPAPDVPEPDSAREPGQLPRGLAS